MMGGCFAMNEAGAAVETYWHAHAVRPSGAINFATPFPIVSFINKPIRFFGRLENHQWISQDGQVLYWGAWTASYNVCFLGGTNSDARAILQRNNPYVSKSVTIPQSAPIPWEEFTFSDNIMSLLSNAGSKSHDFSYIPVITGSGVWNARIPTLYAQADVCAYTGYSQEGGYQFNIQPMCSPSGATAFFDVDNPELIEQ